jgi:hypothetical protein
MSDQVAEGTGTDSAGERRTITPQPKRIVNLSNTLGSRPAPRRPQPIPPEPAPARSDATPKTPGASAPESQPTPITKARKPRDGRSGGGVAGRGEQEPAAPRRTRQRDHTVFYVSLDVSEQVRDLARRADLTNADVIFDAIEGTQDQLPQLLAAPTTPAASDRLFARAERRPVGKKVQISAVISPSNLAAMDGLVEELGADSRSHLVEVALSAFFTSDAVAIA